MALKPSTGKKNLRARTLGVITTTMLTMGCLSLGALPAQAHEIDRTPPPSWIQAQASTDFNNNEALYAALNNSIDQYGDGTQQVELYKVGDSTPLYQEGGMARGVNYTVPRPTSGYEQYYFKLGDLTSNIITVAADGDEWQGSLQYSNTVFTTDDDTPVGRWTFAKNVADDGKAVYIVDQASGKILHRDQQAGTTDTFTVPRFSAGYRNYIAYVADWSASADNLSDLAGIVAATDSVQLRTADWWSGISVDNSQGRDPLLHITTNQSVVDTHLSDQPYALYLVDTTTNTVLAKNDTMSRSWDYQVQGLADNERHTYQTVVAANTASLPTDPDDLTDVQTYSEVAKARGNGWTTNLTVDNEYYTTADASPVFTWHVNKALDDNPGFGLYIVNTGTNQVVKRIHAGGTTGTFTVGRDTVANYSGSYEAILAEWDPTIDNYYQLLDNDAASNVVQNMLQPFRPTLMAHPTRNGNAPFLRVRTLQPVLDANSNGAHAAAYIVNADTGVVVAKNAQMLRSWDWEVPQADADAGVNYNVVIAADRDTLPDSVWDLFDENMLDLDFTNVNFADPAADGFHVQLKFDTAVTSGTSNMYYTTDDAMPNLSWAMDDDIHDEGRAVYITYAPTGEILHTIYNTDTEGTVTLPRVYDADQALYKAYVADYDANATNASDLQNLRSVSEPLAIEVADWIPEVKATASAFTVSLNQSLHGAYDGATPRFGAYVYDATAGEFVHEYTSNVKDQKVTYSDAIAGHAYVVYVAHYTNPDNLPTSPADLEAVQVASTPVEAGSGF